ncbi:AI-2E family transporter [Microbacterium murale]|uniref:AI-2E family transporter n=1 Tax=Microbacterium murale TaxID=1081040 RepID=A0ABQ1RTK2_9MICO|nr:AI-2E family transporter [Microbacterium murale]GGD81669.1 AI-2E family transporter [Microbacterium murale]
MSGSRLVRMLPARPLVSGLTVAIGVIIAVALATAVASISSVLITVFLGLFLALGLDPAVGALERRGIRRGWGITIVAVSFLILVVVIALSIVPATIRQFAHLVEAAPEAFEAIQASDWFIQVESALGIDLSAAVVEGLRSVTNLSNFLAVSGGVLRAGFGIVGGLSSAVMIVVLTLYFVSSMPMMKAALTNLRPAYHRAQFASLLDQITTSVGRVVAGGITLSTFNAVMVFVLQLAIGSAIPVLLGIVAFFVTLVPMIGSLVFLVIGSVSALFVSPWAAGVFLIGYFVYIQFEAYFLTPRIMGRAVALPAVLVITGAMIGAALMGLLGALVAIPITASVLIILREVVIPRQDARTTAPEE